MEELRQQRKRTNKALAQQQKEIKKTREDTEVFRRFGPEYVDPIPAAERWERFSHVFCRLPEAVGENLVAALRSKGYFANKLGEGSHDFVPTHLVVWILAIVFGDFTVAWKDCVPDFVLSADQTDIDVTSFNHKVITSFGQMAPLIERKPGGGFIYRCGCGERMMYKEGSTTGRWLVPASFYCKNSVGKCNWSMTTRGAAELCRRFFVNPAITKMYLPKDLFCTTHPVSQIKLDFDTDKDGNQRFYVRCTHPRNKDEGNPDWCVRHSLDDPDIPYILADNMVQALQAFSPEVSLADLKHFDD